MTANVTVPIATAPTTRPGTSRLRPAGSALSGSVSAAATSMQTPKPRLNQKMPRHPADAGEEVGLDVGERDADDRVVEERQEEHRAQGGEGEAAALRRYFETHAAGAAPWSLTSWQKLEVPTFQVPFSRTAVPFAFFSTAWPPSI